MKQKIFCVFLAFLCLHAYSALISDICVFPADFQAGKYSINALNTIPIRLHFLGNGKELSGKGANLVIDVPEYMEVLGASPLHISFIQALPVRREGNRVAIQLPRDYISAMINPVAGWRCEMNVYLRAKKDGIGKVNPISWSIESQGTKLFSKQTTIQVVEPLRFGKNKLSHFKLGMQSLHSMGLPFPDIVRENINYWTMLHQRPVCLYDDLFAGQNPAYKGAIARNFQFIYWPTCHGETMIFGGMKYGFYDKGRVTRPGARRFVNANGSQSEYTLCPLYMLEDTEKVFWDHYVKEGLERTLSIHPEMTEIAIDFESHAEHGVCDACRSDFAKRYSLSEVPSREAVAPGKPLHQKWRKYRADQRTKIVARFSQVVRTYFPNKKFRLCTVPLIPGRDPLNEWSGIDTLAMNPYVDSYLNMLFCEGKEYYEMLEYNIQKLQKPQFPCVDVPEPLLEFYSRYTPARIRQNILATAALGGEGFMLCPCDYFDAEYLNVFNEVCNAIAVAEAAYARHSIDSQLKYEILNSSSVELTDGKSMVKIEVPELSTNIRAKLHQDDTGTYFATLFNFSRTNPAFLKLSIPNYQGTGVAVGELIGDIRLEGVDASAVRNGFTVKVEPNGCVLLRISKDAYVYASTMHVSRWQIQLQDSLKLSKKNLESFRMMKDGNRSIGWKLHKKEAVLELKDCQASICVNPNNGGLVTSWNVVGIGDVLGMAKDLSLGEIVFYENNPAIPKPIPFAVVNRHCVGGPTSVTLSYTIPKSVDAGGSGNPLAGLQLDRIITLQDYSSCVAITHRLTNHADKSMRLGFRLKNLPVYFWFPDETKGFRPTLANGARPGNGETLCLRPGADIDWAGKHLPPITLEDTSVVLRQTKFPIALQIGGKDFAGTYLWSDGRIQTVEALSPMVELKPGESRTLTLHFRVVNVK